jgi:glycosyltransferase involved in cell wall biosynthesis
VQFVIVGDGPLRGEVHALIGRLGLEKSVHMWGRSEDSCSTMQLLDTLVLTSVSEGCPNVLLEAAEIGVPVVTTAAGGAAEIVKDGETGFVVPCRDHQSLARCVIQLIDEDRLRQRYIEDARAHVRSHFTAEKMVERLDGLYRRELSRSIQMRYQTPSFRVCFILSQVYGVFRPHPDRVFGGAEIQVANLAKQLARSDACEVFVLTGDRNRTGREEIEEVAIVLDPLCAPPWPSSPSANSMSGAGDGPRRSKIVEWGYRWLAGCPPSLATLSRSLVRGGVVCKNVLRRLLPVDWCIHAARRFSLLLQWVRLLNKIDADVYVTRCAGGIVGYMQRACAIIRRPFVYMVAHDMDVSGDYAATYPVDGTLFERGLRSADLVVCQNENQARLLDKRYHKQGCIVPSLSPFELAEGLDHSNRKVVLWIARVDEWKQPELFVQLAERIPDQSFLMVAVESQVHPTQLDKIRKAAAIVPNLNVVPPVPFHESTKLFRQAAVFVNTSRAEGFPNTFLQAAASGTPIVSWVVNPDDMLTRHEMGFCAQEDWAGFVQSIRLLCRDENLRMRMGSNGQTYVCKRHAPASIAQTYLDMFRALREGSVLSPRSVERNRSGHDVAERLLSSTRPDGAHHCGVHD